MAKYKGFKTSSAYTCQHWVRGDKRNPNCVVDDCNHLLLGQPNCDHMIGMTDERGFRYLVSMPYASASKEDRIALLPRIRLYQTSHERTPFPQDVFIFTDSPVLDEEEPELDDIIDATGHFVYGKEWK